MDRGPSLQDKYSEAQADIEELNLSLTEAQEAYRNDL